MLSAVSGTTGTMDALDSEIKILFPEIVQQKINTVEFLAAARGVVRIVGKLGKVFAPVRYDIQGNIDKLAARYATDTERNVTLQDMILIEKSSDPKLVAMDALLWLTRGLHMILLFFEKIIEDSKTGSPTEDLVAFLKKSYKEALEPYHGWMAQQLFDVNPFANGSHTLATFVCIVCSRRTSRRKRYRKRHGNLLDQSAEKCYGDTIIL
ncbi:glycolipid transfer protein isoform X2 [Lasioglossum baleicum]|uniref:glycolipid transfer protein isoform X2 n=1 Tax=Lasioglossum baleicum TaxID=434251 RepID=UPI003FCD48FE